MIFARGRALLLVIDMQERLLRQIEDAAKAAAGAITLAKCSKILGVPALVTEQYPEGIGPTLPGLSDALERRPAIAKRTFSCCREPAFLQGLAVAGRKQVIIAGIEAHVCVLQTAFDLVEKGYTVQVAEDAVGSRKNSDKLNALKRMQAAGIGITCVESAVFELLETSACPEFKQVLPLIK